MDAYNRERKNEKTRLYPKGFHPIATPTLIKIEKEKKEFSRMVLAKRKATMRQGRGLEPNLVDFSEN